MPRPRAHVCSSASPHTGSVLSLGQPRLVLRSDAGESSDSLSIGPACIRLVRVGPSRMPSRADAQAVGRRSDIQAEYEEGLAQTKDGASGGLAEE